MNPAEDCLKYLKNRNWIELNKVLSDNKNAKELAESPAFLVFENVFIDELKRYETETSEDQLAVASRVFQLHQFTDSNFTLSENALKKIARFLFDKNPEKKYAIILCPDSDAMHFLESEEKTIQVEIDTRRLGGNLNIRVGESGRLQFDKDIFNDSPQEKELYLAAKSVLPDMILLPNTALSTVISSKVCDFLETKTSSFFYKSTLDLCVVNPMTFRPELFIELDSSWHDKPGRLENDKMKDEIFQKAGLKLHRLRKKENKEMTEIFELFIKNNYTS
ncbi:MAG: DUF2726 domain-containing protein [Bacteroidota bacterium]|nr:DUF2726 domain-containing protein [Bacteroidota bacterium]